MTHIPSVQVYKEKREIRTYPLREPDKNPFISKYLGSLMFYPYPLKNNLSKKSQDVTYELFCVENDYIKLTVLPDLGGKVYSCVDKRTSHDIFYRNPVIKPQLIGATGAWTSGGVEFNFPNRGHRPSATEYTDTCFKEYEDGSASIVICDIDKISWNWFTVELRLYPTKSSIEQIVRMYNPKGHSDSYYLWTTSSELEKPGIEWRFPCLWHIEEDGGKKKPWPLPEDGPFAGEGVDLRFNDTMKPFTLPFASETLKDYMGVYYPGDGTNVVHVADFREVPGKKVWSWGQSLAAENWAQRLTDNGERYIELQSGMVETQNQYNIIEAHNCVEVRKYWLHTNKIGPLCAASKDVVAAYKVEHDRLKFEFSGTDTFDDVEFTLQVGSKVEFSEIIRLSPKEPTQVELPMELFWMDYDISISLVQQGIVLLQETIIDNDTALVMIAEEPYIPADETRECVFAEARHLEKKRHYNDALALYQELLEENPDYMDVYIRMASCYLSKRDPKGALEILDGVLEDNNEHIELLYTYGLALWGCGQRSTAVQYFYKVPISSSLFAAANYIISLHLLGQNKCAESLYKLEYSSRYQGRHYKSTLLQAYIFLITGRGEEAKATLVEHLENHPIDYVAMVLLDELEESHTYRDLILQRDENVYTVLDFFRELGDEQRSLALINQYKERKHVSTLLGAYAHYYAGRIEHLVAAIEEMDLDYVFPNHPVDLEILGSIKDDSDQAKYLYSLMQYRAENYEVATKLWWELVEKDFHYSALYRSLSYYHLYRQKDYETAIEIARTGVNKKPFNDSFYNILHLCYVNLGWRDEIGKLAEQIETLSEKTEPCVRVWIDILNYLGEHKRALEILENADLTFYEHDPEGLMPYIKIYLDTYLGLVREALEKRDYDVADVMLSRCLALERQQDEAVVELYFYQGVIREKQGDFAGALKSYKKIMDEPIPKGTENYIFKVKATQRTVKLNWIGIC